MKCQPQKWKQIIKMEEFQLIRESGFGSAFKIIVLLNTTYIYKM